MSREEILRILRAELPALRSEFGVRSVGIFGSCARGTQTDTSDVDIIAEFERPIGLRFVDFSEHIERILGRRADILTPAGLASIRNPRIADSVKRSLIYV